MGVLARSSEDDYCPPEDVEFIQEAVLKVLRQMYSPVKLTLAYKEEEADWLIDVNPPTLLTTHVRQQSAPEPFQ